jgi:hypothetical protein
VDKQGNITRGSQQANDSFVMYKYQSREPWLGWEVKKPIFKGNELLAVYNSSKVSTDKTTM